MYGLLLKLVWFIHPQVPQIHNSAGFLFNDILSVIKPACDLYPVTYSVITYFLLYTQAISFNQIIMNRRLMQKPNYLPAMSYLLITSFFSEWNILSGTLVINSLLIWVWAKLSNLYNNKQAKATLFNIGILVGLCSFFYFPSLAFLVLVFFGLLITRPPRMAEWLVTMLGVITPWYFLFSWLFLTNRLYSFHLPGFHVSVPNLSQKYIEYTAIALLLLITIIGAFLVQSHIGKYVVQVRKSWSVMILYLIVALAVPFINSGDDFEYWIIALVPVAAFAASAFYYPRKKWIPFVLQWIMVGMVIYLQYVGK
jgi:hypothetical protein